MTLKRIIRLVGSVGVIPSLPSPQWHHTAVFSSHRFKSSLATAEKEADNATEGRKGHQSIQQTTTRQKIAKEFGEGSLFEKLEAKFERDVARIRERRERQQQAALLMSPQILDRNRNPTENAHDQTAGDGAASTKPDTTLVGRLRAKLDDTFSLERNLAERDKLWTMAFKEGYFTSAKEVLRDGQKFGEASRTLLAPERAPFLLDLKDGFVLESGSKVNLLSLVKGKVSLVTVASAGFAEPHIRTYLDPFLHEFGTLDDVQLIQVNIEENPLKSLVQHLFIPYIRRNTPQALQKTYFLYPRSLPYKYRDQAGMKNKYVGYVMVVDAAGRIRWRANGPAADHEIDTMIKGIRTLVEEAK